MSEAASEHGEEIPTVGKYTGDRNEQLQRHGNGHNLFPNGDVFDGQYQEGKRRGKGKYIWKATGARYDGEYLHGLRHGQGEFIYPDGSKYVGEFNQGKKQGKGTYTFTNGDVYDGEWENDLRHGKGVYHYAGLGVQKSGEWKQGQLQGQGEVIYPGMRLKGSFINNESMESNAQVQYDFINKYQKGAQDPIVYGLKPIST